MVFYMGSEEAHHKEQNMAGCCMSIYDISHGHVHHPIFSWQKHDCQLAPMFFTRFCIYTKWWHSCLETIQRHTRYFALLRDLFYGN